MMIDPTKIYDGISIYIDWDAATALILYRK